MKKSTIVLDNDISSPYKYGFKALILNLKKHKLDLKTLKKELEKQEELMYHLNAKTAHLRVIETLFLAPDITEEANSFLKENRQGLIDRSFCVPCTIKRSFRPYKQFIETILTYAPLSSKRTLLLNYGNNV